MAKFGSNFKLFFCIFAICFLVSEYLTQRFNQPLDKNGKTTNFGRFLATPDTFLAISQTELGR